MKKRDGLRRLSQRPDIPVVRGFLPRRAELARRRPAHCGGAVASPTNALSFAMLRTLVQPSHLSDVHGVYNQQQAPRSGEDART